MRVTYSKGNSLQTGKDGSARFLSLTLEREENLNVKFYTSLNTTY